MVELGGRGRVGVSAQSGWPSCPLAHELDRETTKRSPVSQDATRLNSSLFSCLCSPGGDSNEENKGQRDQLVLAARTQPHTNTNHVPNSLCLLAFHHPPEKRYAGLH